MDTATEKSDAATAVETPPPAAPPKPTATQAAIAAAKAAIEAGTQKNELTEPDVADTGTTVKTPKPEPPAEAPAEEPAPETPAEEQPPVEEEAKEEAPAEEPQEPPAEDLLVTLPAVRDGQEPLEIEVGDKETAERLRAVAKGGIRRDTYHRAMQDVETRADELRQAEDEIEIDPTNFIFGRLPEEQHIPLARELLAQPKVFEALKGDLETWMQDEGATRETARLALKEQRTDRLGASQAEVNARREGRQAGRALRNAVSRMVPESMADESATALFDDLMRDLRDHAVANPDKLLRPGDVGPILERRLRLYGVDVKAAIAAATATDTPPVLSRVPRSPTKPAAPAPKKPDEAAARAAGQKLVAQAKARKAGAKVPGTGAGSPGAGPELPPNQSIKQRTAMMRERLGLRPK